MTDMTREPITVQERVQELVAEHGSYRKAAAVIGVSGPYMFRLAKGKFYGSPETARKLGLNPDRLYNRIVVD